MWTESDRAAFIALITPFWRLAQQQRKAREKRERVQHDGYADILGDEDTQGTPDDEGGVL